MDEGLKKTTAELKPVLMMGNEAIARGALEGGIDYATGYPGNPSSEIVETLFKFQKKYPLAVEWSVNEIVALEAAAAFAFTGQRAVVTMKQNGMNVCADFLATVCLNRLQGGLLVVVCDDPGPLTSSNEQDSRHFAKMAQVPLLEPSTPQEAKEMAVYGLELSQKFGLPVILRAVSRLAHGRGAVTRGAVKKNGQRAQFDLDSALVALPFLVTQNHARLLSVMKQISTEFETSQFNSYEGPDEPKALIVASGLSAVYATEAVSILNLWEKAGLLKIGTTWPLPEKWIKTYLGRARKIIFAEDVDPFLEDAVKVVYATDRSRNPDLIFHGKYDGLVAGDSGPGVGEMNTDIMLRSLRRVFGLKDQKKNSIPADLKTNAQAVLIPRELSFCQGCPHRASFFAIKNALMLNDRKGFVVGDIGCYGLAAGTTGYNQIKALHCMGSGMGNISGFSQMATNGFDQTVVAICGDSTFFHGGIPALVNAVHHQRKAVFVVLDNSITAMTGFQTNPGTPGSSSGSECRVSMEDTAKGIGAEVCIVDPVNDVQKAIDTLLEVLGREYGVDVIIFRHPCVTWLGKISTNLRQKKARIDLSICLGRTCGCNSFCTRILSCPAIIIDADTGGPRIEEPLCTGCGLCAQVCPEQSIRLIRQDGGDA